MHSDRSVIRFPGDKATGCGDDGCTGCVPASFEPGALPKYGSAVDTCFPICIIPATGLKLRNVGTRNAPIEVLHVMSSKGLNLLILI